VEVLAVYIHSIAGYAYFEGTPVDDHVVNIGLGLSDKRLRRLTVAFKRAALRVAPQREQHGFAVYEDPSGHQS
jgi:hypothetical protein